MDRCVIVLLAAGGGRRFAGPTHKLLSTLPAPGGKPTPLWRVTLDAARAAQLGPVILVTGAVALPADEIPDGVEVVDHRGWEMGMASSLHAGLAAAEHHRAAAAVIGLADQPGVGAAAWRAVADAPDAPHTPIVVARYGDHRGPHPVRLRRDVWRLLPSTGDHGARRLLAEHPAWVAEVACVGSPTDIDTAEDLARWRS